MVRAILSLFGAITAFGADIAVHGRIVHVSTPAQSSPRSPPRRSPPPSSWSAPAHPPPLLGAPRPDRGAADGGGRGLGSVALDQITAHAGLDLMPLYGVALFTPVDLCAVWR
jgi:hypothetical protein